MGVWAVDIIRSNGEKSSVKNAGNPCNRKESHQIIVNQSYEQLNKKKENTRFNEVRQFAYALGARGESSY